MAQGEKMLISLDEILRHPDHRRFSFILCYPHPMDSEVSSRIQELQSLGVEALVFRGRANLHGVPVLGKGHVGVVVVALRGGRECALKIRRVDADRGNMRREVEMLREANRVSVGPRLLGYTDNFILMELVEGKNLREWLREAQGEGARRTLRDLLERCRRLDVAGIDHGELSRAHRHVIVTPPGEARIIDFETASTSRRVSNVTSIAHYLFFHRENSQILQRILGQMDLQVLRSKLKEYKKELTDEGFREILTLTYLLNGK